MVVMRHLLCFAAVLATCAPGSAQPVSKEAPKQVAAADPQAKQEPAPLVVFFESGSSDLHPRDKAVLDRASRAYNEGKPIVMILTASADRVGGATTNLMLSEKRARAVLKGLLDRGIPADRFQLLAKGQTELPVVTGEGIAEPRNRSVAISWR